MRRSWSAVRFVAGSVVLAAGTGTLRAEVRLPAILGDGMVLQRESAASLWGRSAPGAEIRIAATWTGGSATARADERGEWRASVATPGAGGPYEIRFEGDGERTLRDVWIGEVWLCSGQSNMEWSLARFPDEAGAIDSAEFPRIRLFDVDNRLSNHELRDVRGTWRTCSPATAGAFSATAFHFGRKLHRELDVPIGLVTADWGGTPIRSWISAES